MEGFFRIVTQFERCNTAMSLYLRCPRFGADPQREIEPGPKSAIVLLPTAAATWVADVSIPT